MFWKKRKSPADKVLEDAAKIVAALKPKWVQFCKMMPFPPDEQLERKHAGT